MSGGSEGIYTSIMSNRTGDLSQNGVTLSNTLYSEIAPCLSLPSLPVFCGAADDYLCLSDEQAAGRNTDFLPHARRIADLLRDSDISYLNLKNDVEVISDVDEETFGLCAEVIRYNPDAFKYNFAGTGLKQISSPMPDEERRQRHESIPNHLGRHSLESHSDHKHENIPNHLGRHTVDGHSVHHTVPISDATSFSRKPKVKKKEHQETFPAVADPVKHQDSLVRQFCEVVVDFCGRVEAPSEDHEEVACVSVSVPDLKFLMKEINIIQGEKMLHFVPVEVLTRIVRVLDHQIRQAEGLSIDECEHSDSNVSLVFSALESIHVTLMMMVQPDMPKQIYKEEIIERMIEFSRRQIMDVMAIRDPSYRALHRPSTNGADEGEEDDCMADVGSASKKRRLSRSNKTKRLIVNRFSSASNVVLQKLCTILGFLKELLLIERLSDSCILQLVKTNLSTFLVDNIQLLQLKAISLISGIFSSYSQHRTYIVDEVVQLLWKLPFSKRVTRTYHLPDEEQKQIQMITALLLSLVHHSSNFPDTLRQSLNSSVIPEGSVYPDYLIKCHEAATETCALFWTHILQRFAAAKSQDVSELKVIVENLVLDLLTALNLPEYPATTLILEVLSVLLLQNAGPKSKDTSIRLAAIDIFGTIAARMKHEFSLCNSESLWIVRGLFDRDGTDGSDVDDSCSICSDVKAETFMLACQGCQRSFHAECMVVKQHDIPSRGWFCPFCISRKRLLLIRSYCKDNGSSCNALSEMSSEATDSTSHLEIVQQILLDYLQDTGSPDDLHVYTCWFYLCLWYKDDPESQQKLSYIMARLKSKVLIRGSVGLFSLLTRPSLKKITAALGQKSSFCRGFDRIFCMLLACLRENSPVIRAKALRAVSLIVEADPDVLCDKRVQSAVEGRFCDSAISVREAALELVGRHIASHPDVGLKYFEKICERVKDTGVSVRKRAIKIIRDMCLTDNFPQLIHACIEIMSRVNDEESSIQDLVCKTFHEFWFEEPSGVQSQYYGDGSTVPLEVTKKTEQIVDMLRKIQNHQSLVTVIKRNLALDFFPQSVKAAGINPVSLATVRSRCELICKCLLERILQVQEIANADGEVQMLPYVMVLHAFCTVDPALCAPASDPLQFVVTLQPYLKNQVDNRAVAKLLESIISIIDAVLPFLKRLPASLVDELEQDLKNMIIRHSFMTVVHTSIKCLCSVGMLAGKVAALVDLLIQLFFKRLDFIGADNKQIVGRSLFCLGLLIRYGNPLLSASNRVLDISSSLCLLKKYIEADDLAIKVRALQALGHVLIARPDCMLENDVGRIIGSTLSSCSDAELKLQSLQNMYEYLLDAESQMKANGTDHGAVDYNEMGGTTVPVAAGAGDTNICGGIVQLYWDNILERSLDMNEQVRQSALKIVEVVVRQGLVHPITCVPYLIALETDPQEVNSKLAHHLLTNMNEKYPAFFESRLGDGLQLSFHFIQSLKGLSGNSSVKDQQRAGRNVKDKHEDLSFTNARLGISRIYKLIRGNRVARNKFMSSVVRKFDNPRWSDTVIPFLMYCTDILALLPFTSPDEPLYLIYTINRVIQVRSGTLEATLKALSVHFSRGDVKLPHLVGGAQMELSTDLVSSDATETDGNSQSNMGSQHFYFRSSTTDESIDLAVSDNSCFSGEDLQRIQADCVAATALQLLLKLKRHLKIVYNLDDVRCQAFSPTEPPKSGEVLPKQSIPFSIGDLHNDLPTTSQELTQRYQEYKNALKEDTVDYSAYSANIKRKRPPARRSGKGGRGKGGDDGDYDEDDDAWTSGVRRPMYNVRQGYNTRSVQRF